MSATKFSRVLSGFLVVALVLPAAPLQAASADELRDIVGARGRDGENVLERRGYTFVDGSKSRNASYTYWWSNSKRQCVRVTTRDGIYAQIVDASPSDCGQTRKETALDDNAKVALAAAALIGVAALAHKSHQREDKNYDERQLADFERGYRDGLYNNTYHNYDNRRDYSDGYSKGVEERTHQSSYRSNSYYSSGYQPYVNVQDLAYRDLGYAASEIQRRGFFLVKDHNLGGGERQWLYFNRSTRQCVEMVSRDMRIAFVGGSNDYACR